MEVAAVGWQFVAVFILLDVQYYLNLISKTQHETCELNVIGFIICTLRLAQFNVKQKFIIIKKNKKLKDFVLMGC